MSGTFVTATLHIPPHIFEGLANGTLERVGGVVREVGSKQVVMWLREGAAPVGKTLMDISTVGIPLNPAELVADVANLGVSWKGFSDMRRSFRVVNRELTHLSHQIDGVQTSVNGLHQLMYFNSAVSVLSLGVSVIGFAIITQRINEIEGRLKSMEKTLKKLDQKIDLGFSAKFKGALKLAKNAFTMDDADNRRSFALQAIDHFSATEHIYLDYTAQELRQQSPAVEEYLLLLALLYIAETRCYLELNAPSTALERLQEGLDHLREFGQRYVEMHLTSNPAAYLDPSLKEEVSFGRLARIYQWIDPTVTDENIFENLRESIFEWHKDCGMETGFRWLKWLPPTILPDGEAWGGALNPLGQAGQVQKAMEHLPEAMTRMEIAIETYNRLESYQTEVQAMLQLGMSFQDWMNLAPQGEPEVDSSVMYLVPAEPLRLGVELETTTALKTAVTSEEPEWSWNKFNPLKR